MWEDCVEGASAVCVSERLCGHTKLALFRVTELQISDKKTRIEEKGGPTQADPLKSLSHTLSHDPGGGFRLKMHIHINEQAVV